MSPLRSAAHDGGGAAPIASVPTTGRRARSALDAETVALLPGGEPRLPADLDDARGALGADPYRSLSEPARELAVSPHHLSRVFRAHTGHTISHYRVVTRSAGGDSTKFVRKLDEQAGRT
jgi:AraC-like DNA-binding protein